MNSAALGKSVEVAVDWDSFIHDPSFTSDKVNYVVTINK